MDERATELKFEALLRRYTGYVGGLPGFTVGLSCGAWREQSSAVRGLPLLIGFPRGVASLWTVTRLLHEYVAFNCCFLDVSSEFLAA